MSLLSIDQECNLALDSHSGSSFGLSAVIAAKAMSKCSVSFLLPYDQGGDV